MFYAFMIAIATFNIVPTNNYLSVMLDEDLDTDPYLNDQFNNYGYGSLNVLMNLGLLGFFLIFKFFLIAFLLLLRLIARCSSK